MIKNKRSKPINERLTEIEKARYDRYAQQHFICDELMKHFIDIEVTRNAMRRCGVWHAETVFPEKSDLYEIEKVFVNDETQPLFEMESEVTPDRWVVQFHYCPAVACWQKLGVSEENIRQYCDIGMDGDRGIFSHYPDLEMELTKTIAWGDDVCEVIVTRKKNS